MHHKLTIRITEPTMSGGIWRLAQFHYRDVFGISYRECEEMSGDQVADLICREARAQMRGLSCWLDTVPPVDEWWQCPESSNENDIIRDAKLHILNAKGWFQLDDNVAKTERMLAQVNFETLDFPQRLYVPLPPDDDPEGTRHINWSDPAWSAAHHHRLFSLYGAAARAIIPLDNEPRDNRQDGGDHEPRRRTARPARRPA